MAVSQVKKGGRIARESVREYLDRQLAMAQKKGAHEVAQFIVKARRWVTNAPDRYGKKKGGL